VSADFPDSIQLLKHKIAYGTKDFSCGNAMTAQECTKALQTGCDLATSSGADLLGLGEMGIGNSASAAALYALLLDLEGDVTTGAGTGAQGPLLAKKKRIIKKAVRFHRERWDSTAFNALCRCGGFEIAAMTGAMLGAASQRVPVVVDGFICGAAALCALRFNPAISDYLFFAHVSAERFHRSFLKKEGIVPLLDLKMRLGEGTGSVLGMQIIIQALNCYFEMATFASASVSREIEE
jgi:nicotinate-nucleotide--dimethylbenzimidazole phosphoribosyltransferase